MMKQSWQSLAIAAWLIPAGLAWSGCRNDDTPAAGAANKAPKASAAPVTLGAGTTVTGTLQNTISTDKSRVGEPVVLKTTVPVVVAGQTVVPAGSTVHGSVTHVRSAGRMKGAAELTVRFNEVVLPNGQHRAATFEPLRHYIKGDGKETAAEIGGGAAVGGILGGVIGGGDGALKGGAIGAAVGTGVAVATKGEQIVLPAGHVMQLRLAAPMPMVS
jgi:hypothetical protein